MISKIRNLRVRRYSKNSLKRFKTSILTESSAQSINSSIINNPFNSDQPIENINQLAIKDKSFDQKSFSILSDHHQNLKIDEKFILKLPKDIKNVSKDVKNSCKILQFSSEWSYEEVLTTVNQLNPKDYPQLFIFLIEQKNFEFLSSKNKKVKKIKKIAKKFAPNRPLLIQLTSEDEKVTKIRYKNDDSNDFEAFDQENLNFWDTKNFPSFLCNFLDGKFENFDEFDDKFQDLLPQIHKTSLLLKFWSTLNFSDAHFDSIILEVSKTGTKTEFLAALDAPFEDNMGILRSRAEQYLPYVISNDGDNPDELNDPSVLLVAVQNQNNEVIDYLVTFWTHLIQQLPFEHQVRISQAAFESNQLDVLCDLLDIADFPFPKDFKADHQQNHEKLDKIIQERSQLVQAIKTQNLIEIKQFIDSNPSLRTAYNIINKSAMQQAIDAKHYNVYFYLKSFGFKASEFSNLEDILTADELKTTIQAKKQQRCQNINEALTEDQKSVNLLCNRSFIHNRRIDKELEKEYRKEIRKWYEDIRKIKFGDLFLDVAASCESLKIIFDFENCSVENISFQSSGTLGSMFPSLKWIFVGAKLTDNENNKTKAREQEIKGVLAHELCHYVMKLVYENQENPYYKIMIKIAEMFEEIVKVIKKWSAEGPNDPDDECNGTISSVFRHYESINFHPELIVRVVQMLAEFDDDEGKIKHLEEKYKILFDFWENQVIPDLRRYDLKSREAVRKMNRLFEVIDFLKSELYYFNEPKDIKTLFDSNLTIITSNVPTLLLNDMLNYLQDKIGDLFDTENVFVDPEELENKEILADFTKLLLEYPKLNVIVNCSSKIPEKISNLRGLRTIFIVSTKAQYEELLKALNELKEPIIKMDMNYNWSDLTQESQEVLLDHTISFQGWTGLSINQLLMPENCLQEPKSSESYKQALNQVLKDFSSIIDDELLNLLVNGQYISINVSPDVNQGSEKRNFDFLFIEREFNKKTQKEILFKDNQTVNLGLFVNRQGQMMFVPNISQEQLLFDVQDNPVVLISDIAGNGKSWVMKNFADTFREAESIKWVTYVDLKEFIDEFRVQKSEPEFADFVVEKMLMPQQQFEGKIFHKMYNAGKVMILFDGFDEIAPDCAEFVSKLAQNFKSNGGNKLWIATRDYFEVDLMQKLNTDAVYKIRELNKGEAISLIAQSWVLMEDGAKFESSDEFYKYVTCPDKKYENYLQKAHQIVDKYFSKWLSPVGMPHLLSMIAECYKNDKDGVDLNLSIIFEKFMEKQIENWSCDKGPIRKMTSVKSHRFNVSVWKLHQYYAIAVLFPEHLKALFPDCNVSEWPVEKIVACGLMSILGGKIFFVHETYGEFFVADLIANELKKTKIDEKIVEIFIKILTNQKYMVLRGFVNGLIEDTTLEKIQPKMKEIMDIFDKNSSYKFEHFVIEMFLENLDKFIIFILKVIKCETYNRKMEILKKSAASVASNIKDKNSFEAFKNLVFESLNLNDLKDLIINYGLLLGIFRSSLDIKAIENFIDEFEAKTDRETIKFGLLSNGTFGFGGGNIFHHLSQSSKFDPPTFKIILQICQKYLTFNETCGLIRHCNEQNHNIIMLCIMSPSFREIKQFWREIMILYAIYCSSHQLKEFLKQEDSRGFITVEYLIPHPDVKLHEDLWEILLSTFDNRDELKNLILKNDKENNTNSFHKLMMNPNHDVIKLLFKILQQNFTNTQYSEIIKSKGFGDFTLLQSTAGFCNIVDVHRLVWEIVHKACSSDAEFSKFIKKISTDGTNILHYCAQISTKEVFEFIIERLEKYLSFDEIKIMLSQANIYGCLMLHYSALQNINLDSHVCVWKVMRKYFKTLEIVNLIQQKDVKCGENILFTACQNNLQIQNFIWNEIKQCLTYDEQVKYLKIRNKDGRNLLERVSVQTEDNNIKNVKIYWVKRLFKDYKIEGQEMQLT